MGVRLAVGATVPGMRVDRGRGVAVWVALGVRAMVGVPVAEAVGLGVGVFAQVAVGDSDGKGVFETVGGRVSLGTIVGNGLWVAFGEGTGVSELEQPASMKANNMSASHTREKCGLIIGPILFVRMKKV
jgi:hypothetical protein